MKKVFTRKNRILLGELVRTDFKLRYQASSLGYMWSLLRPLFLFGILYLVFGQILKFGRDIPFYPVYLLLGIVIWSFFVEATKQGSTSIISRGGILRKIFFPKYIVVFSSSISALINLALNLLVVLVFIIISGANINYAALILVPLLLIELYVFALAIAFILATINVRYRDIQHVWDIVVQAGFYATPIIYPIALVVVRSNELAAAMLAFNPVAQIIHDLRAILVTDKTQTLYDLTQNIFVYLIPISITVILSVIAVFYFKSRSKYFTEEL